MDRLYILVITLHLSILAKTLFCNDHTITEFGITDKNSSTAYVILYKLTDMIFGLEQEGGSLIAPMALAHPLHPIDNKSRNKRRNLWAGRCVSSWWPWFPSRSSYIYTFPIWVLLLDAYIYIYIYIYNGSVIQYWRSCTPSRSIGLYFWGVRGSWAECHFLFSLVYQLRLALW